MFKNKRRLFSFMLVLALVLTMNVTVFADTIIDDTPPSDFALTVAGATVDYLAVTVEGGENYPDVTRYTAYIEFLSASGVDLSNVQILASHDPSYSLTVDGTPYMPNMSVDFSDGYVDFTLKDSNNIEYKNYMVNAGISGEDVVITFTFDIHNLRDWLNDDYEGAFGETPSPVDDPVYAMWVEEVVEGFDELPPVMTLNMKVGETAMDALVKASTTPSHTFYTQGAENNYISRMGKTSSTAIGEFDINSYSGWMYKMNGVMPNVGAGQYVLTSSDQTMNWGFTMDYGNDLGGPPW